MYLWSIVLTFVVEDLLKSEFMGSKLKQGLEESTIQESFQKLNLALLTGSPMPLVKADFASLSCSAFQIGHNAVNNAREISDEQEVSHSCK